MIIPVLCVAGTTDGDFFALQIRRGFDAGIGDEIKGDFFRLKVDAFQWRALERGAHAAAAGTAIIDVAAQQSGDRQRTGDNNGFVFSPRL